MSKPIRPLVDVVAEIVDVRQARGKRHPLSAVLLLSCAAMLCGYRRYGAIAEWGRNYGPALLRALGVTRAVSPCAATLYLIFKRLDVAALEAALGGWAEDVLTALPAQEGEREVMAIDGKTLRRSRKQGAPGAHLLSALSHRLGVTLGHEAIATKTGEQSALYTLLTTLLIEGRVLTMDALHTSRGAARTIHDKGGFSVMIVKTNQPQLYDDIATVFALARDDRGHLHPRRDVRQRAWPGRAAASDGQHGSRRFQHLARMTAGLPDRAADHHQEDRRVPLRDGLWRDQPHRPADHAQPFTAVCAAALAH